MTSRSPPRARDLGRSLARLLCALLAVVGLVPFTAAGIVRRPAVRAWAARETSALLERELGVAASYEVEVRPWPLAVGVRDLVVRASDGGGPVLTVARAWVRPRLLPLLAGRLDAGEIEVDAPRARVVVREGALANLDFRAPRSSAPRKPLTRSPFRSLAMTDAALDLDVDGVLVRADEVDVDVTAEEGLAFDVALRAGRHTITRTRRITTVDDPAAGRDAVDEDVVCGLDVRGRVESGIFRVRRLELEGVADLDPAPGTTPRCEGAREHPSAVRVSLGNVTVEPHADGKPTVDGHAKARAPLALANRFVRMPEMHGFVDAEADGHWEPSLALPRLVGRVAGAGLGIGKVVIGQTFDLDVSIDEGAIRSRALEIGFADGHFSFRDVEMRPLDEHMPLKAGAVDATGVSFPALMRDLDITPNTIVGWNLKTLHIAHTEGTIDPLRIDCDISGQTTGFVVHDRSFRDPARKRMIGLREAHITTHFGVRPNAVIFESSRVDFGRSHLEADVSVGFANDLDIVIGKGSKLDLDDVTPIATLPVSGLATISAEMHGKASKALLEGEMSVAALRVNDFPFGDIVSSKVRFVPLVVDFIDAHAKKNKSEYTVKSARLDFDGPATVLADAEVDATSLDVRDFLHIWHFDADPRFAPLFGHGRTHASVHYDLGGPDDACGGGAVRVRGDGHLDTAELFGERYDSVDADFDWAWRDPDASDRGMDLDVRSLVMRKGRGALAGSLSIRQGGELRADLVADDVPASKVQALGPLAALVEGSTSAVAHVSGTTDAIVADVDARAGELRVGTSKLGPSDVRVHLEPERRAPRVLRRTRCGQIVTAPFDRAEWDRDLPQGVFHTTGRIFGGAIVVDDFRTTRQSHKVVSGRVEATSLDLGAIATLVPALASRATPPTGTLSGTLDVESLPLDAPEGARGTLTLTELSVGDDTGRVSLRAGTPPIRIADDHLSVPGVALDATSASGFRSALLLRGDVDHLASTRALDLAVELPDTDLEKLGALFPGVDRASGTLSAKLAVGGTAAAPTYTGAARLAHGQIALHGVPALLDALELEVSVGDGAVRIERATGTLGGGEVSLSGGAPIRGVELGDVAVQIKARNVSLPLADGIRAAFDADLEATLPAQKRSEGERLLPRITGDIAVGSFLYTRPITIAADLGSIAQRVRRRSFESFDPADDVVAFDVRVRAREPLKLRNNLVEAQLALDEGALVVTGSNQRFGLRGGLRVVPGGRVRLRANEFEVRQGSVRFDDPTRVAPIVDVTAVTEYRRYAESQTSGAAATTGVATAGGVGRGGGQWRITLHAVGDADNLRLEMASEPALAQEDIVLLLTLGMTRAEIDQLQASSLGETAALEALSALTGADAVVKRAVPVIDDFRFGSAYSSRTGRTDPTVTVGKRVTDRVRASVTSGLAENREVRTNLEWRVGPRVSVQGNYDNVNDVATSGLGNVGVDVRYRLEFE